MRNLQTTYKPATAQNKAFTASASNATAISAHCYNVRLVSDQNCYVNFEKAAAAADSLELVANVPEYFSIQGGAVISVIRKTNDGNLNITEMTQ